MRTDKTRKRVLVTGINSYIGTSFERYAREHYSQELQVDMVSLRDGSWREGSFSAYDAVFHVAGIAHADVGKATPEEKQRYYEVNRDLALEAAEKAKAEGAGQFVFMSSMIIYGNQERVTRQTKANPANFYGDSKWQADCGLRKLGGDGFQVAVIRPPMIYGPGSKGNYPVLAKMAGRLPVFPKVENKRSVLYIENLCELLCHIILEERGGIFFPQNGETVSTSRLVEEIARCRGHRIWVTRLLAPLVALGRLFPGKIGNLCRKAFGSSYYDMDMSRADGEYRVVDFAESVRRTEAAGFPKAGEGRPLVSITTVTYNSEKTLARTIESVLGQTYDHIEYLIIDGISSDRTVEIAESYRERFAERGFLYTVVSEADRGMYDAINKGIRLSRGAIIGNINSDDWYEAEAVEKAVGFMEGTGCDFMYADLRMRRPDGTTFIKRARQQRLATSRGWNHPTQFARREVHARFPYKLESLHDDFDLFLKVRKSDYRIGVLNEVLADFTMEGMSHDRRLSSAVARGKCRYRIYRNNGYSRWYLLECVMIEAAKILLG